MGQSRIEQDVYVAGNLSAQSVTLPSGTVTNAAVQSAALIDATKLVHQAPGAMGACLQLFEPATAITAVNQTIGMAYSSGSLVAFTAWIEVVATDVSRTVTVDLQKSTGAGAYATVLSATIGFTNASSIRTAVSGTISSASYVAGDIFRVVVTVAGGAGTQAKGLTFRLITRENPS